MLSMTVPSANSTACDSLQFGPTTPPSFHDRPPSSLWMTCDSRTFPPSDLLSHGISSWPLRNWMPTPGPVAYQVQPCFYTSFVVSPGFAQVTPSSSLRVTHTVRLAALLPPTIRASVSRPRLCVISSQTVPVFASTTGQGLPQVLSSSSQTTCVRPHVLPPSVLRLRTRSMFPASPRPVLRPSQKASSVPFLVAMT